MPAIMVTKRILLVEDQEDAAAVLRAGLESLDAGFQVTAVSSAEEALKQLDKASFDLLMADVMLPGISGLELMARFRRRNPDTKAILVSGVRDPEIRKQVARAGADAFFFKPLELADLQDAVERLFGIAQSFLPPELESAKEDEATEGAVKQLAEQLGELRFNLQALCVALINERGQILARAGALPDAEIETSLMPHLMSAFFAAGRIAAFAHSEQPDTLQTFRGAEYHLHLSGISATYAVLIATKPLNAARTAALAEAVQKATGRIAAELTKLERASQPKGREHKESSLSDTDPHLEKVLDRAETRPISRSDTDKYWKRKQKEQSAPRPGALTYEQAAQLGLAPKD